MQCLTLAFSGNTRNQATLSSPLAACEAGIETIWFAFFLYHSWQLRGSKISIRPPLSNDR